MAYLRRWLLELSPARQNVIKLALLAVAVPAFVLAVERDSITAGIVTALALTALWFVGGWTTDGEDADDDAPAVVYEVNPASGQPLIPGAHGLDQQGKPSGMR